KHTAAILAVAFSPDGQRLVTASADGTARLWDSDGKAVGEPLVHKTAVSAVAFSPDGQTLLAGCGNGSIWSWVAVRGQPPPAPGPVPEPAMPGGRTKSSAASGVLAMAYSRDGRLLLVGGKDGVARVWDAILQEPLGYALKHAGPIHAVAFSDDSRKVLTG